MAFFFILPLIAGAAVSALLWLAAEIGGLPQLSTIWIALYGIAAALVGLCIVCAVVATQVLNRLSTSNEENAQFERMILGRLSKLDATVEKPRPEPAIAGPNAPARFAQTLRSGTRNEPAAQAVPPAAMRVEPIAETGNVVQLDPAARIRAVQEKRNRGPSPEILEAIANGRFEAWYQPVLGLPDRKLRYLSGLPYLLTEGSGALAPQLWFDTASSGGRLASMDRFMLLQGIKLCRDLARQEKARGVFWRFCGATLADKAAWREIIEVLRANKSLGGSFLCEISHADYNNLGPTEIEALYAIKEAGFELCLADCSDLQRHCASARPGLFKYVSAEPDEIVRALDSGDPQPRDISFIATGVAREEDAIALIERDVRLAQGPLLAPPKPLRKEGAQAPVTGLRQP